MTFIPEEPKETPLLRRKVGRQTPPSPALEAINARMPYNELRVYLGREHVRPWLELGDR